MADNVHNGMPASLLADAIWLRPSASGKLGNCVELASVDDGHVAVRNSRHPGGPALIYTKAELAAFVTSAKVGEFDELVL
jgi:hypothetical protein